MMTQHRNSTAKNYVSVCRQFSRFLMKLDKKPRLWGDRTTLFIAYLVNNGIQSRTIISYVSAIKKTLVMDGYRWDDTLVMLRSLAKACRIINDKVTTRLPIHGNLLDMILFEVLRYFTKKHQWYLEIMYKTLFALAYYGLMRISELTDSPHVLRARNVHMAANKDKVLLLLYSSKTHDKSSRPQKIKITSSNVDRRNNMKLLKRHFCPFELIRQFINIRGHYELESEQFFIFNDRSQASRKLSATVSVPPLEHRSERSVDLMNEFFHRHCNYQEACMESQKRRASYCIS